MTSSLSLYKPSPFICLFAIWLIFFLWNTFCIFCSPNIALNNAIWQHTNKLSFVRVSVCVCVRLCAVRVAVVVSSANMELELVRQCVDRALVLDDRVSKFSVQLGEWPGDMAKLLDFLSREDVRSAAIRFGIFCPPSPHVGRRPICFSVKRRPVPPLIHRSLWVFLPGCWMSAIGHKATGQTFSRRR